MNEEDATDLSRKLSHFASAFLPKLSALLPSDEAPSTRLPEAMSYAAVGGGKCVRPYIVRCSGDLFGVPRNRSLQVGAAIELVHAYSLVHDDLPALDDDDLRRGRPTCHRAFDEATAILAGNGLLTLAFEILTNPATHPSAETRLDLVSSLASASGASGMIRGQMIDISFQSGPANLSVAKSLSRLKTGALFSFCCSAGAVLAGCASETRQTLEEFGLELGLAFQIVDDLLDVEGDEATLGKRAGKDAAAGKATLVSILGVGGARRELEKVREMAALRLERFGERANALKAVLEFVVSRQR